MKCPTPCVCGRIVELHRMRALPHDLPDGGNLVCSECFCETCEGSGECQECDGSGECVYCGHECKECRGSKCCGDCGGLGYGSQDNGSRSSPLLSDVTRFREAKKRAEKSVRESFPLGSSVRVQLASMSVTAVVHCYVADAPDRLGILFENGNVWDKPVESVELIDLERVARSDQHRST